MFKKAAPPRPQITTPGLNDFVSSLAQAIELSMSSLYNLQAVLILKVTDSYRCNLLSSFKRGRQDFHSQCERIVASLQACQSISEQYVTLLDYMKTEPKEECVTFAKSIGTEVQSLQNEIKKLIKSHAMRIKQLEKLRNEMARLLHVPAKKKGLFSRVASTDLVKKSQPQQIQITVDSLNPDPEAALHETFESLQAIAKALDDIYRFWVAFAITELSAISAGGSKSKGTSKAAKLTPGVTQLTKATQSVPVPEGSETIRKWRSYQTALLSSISTISNASDAAMVNPPGIQNAMSPPGSGVQKQITASRTISRSSSAEWAVTSANTLPVTLANTVERTTKQPTGPKNTTKVDSELYALTTVLQSTNAETTQNTRSRGVPPGEGAQSDVTKPKATAFLARIKGWFMRKGGTG